MSSAGTINDILDELDQIIAECEATNHRLGVFAYVYRRTTAEIAKEIAIGRFEDNKRMEAFDVAFAMLYINAYKNYKVNKPVSKSWAFAFEQAENPLTIIQHILMGMNAHINLDLAIATAATMEGQNIMDLKNDFDKVNAILRQITDELQKRISRVSPLFFLLDILGQRSDEKIIDFSLQKTRSYAWHGAKTIWSQEVSERNKTIQNMDGFALKLSQHISYPNSWILKLILKVIGAFEEKNVSQIILTLYK